MKFGVLGPVEMRGKDSSPIRLGGPRQQVVLATLLLEANRGVTTDHLVECAWWEEPPPSAAVNIRGHVAALRRLLREAGEPPGRLTTHAGGYVLHVEPRELDLALFTTELTRGQEAVARGTARQAARHFLAGLQTWRGRPLEGLPLGSPLRAELQRLREMRLLAIEWYAQVRLDLGQPGTLVPELQALTAQHPYHERFWELLITALYRMGRQAEALAAYARVRGILAEELGVYPMERLQRLEARILRGEPLAGPPPSADGAGLASVARAGHGSREKPVASPWRIAR